MNKKISKKMNNKTFIIIGGGIILFFIVFVLNLNLFFPVVTADYIPPERTFSGEGKVVVEEFGDFGCSMTASAVPYIKRALKEYGSDIDFRFRHFPIVQLHPNAWKAAEASECARDQGNFWPYHDILFEKQGKQTRDYLISYAGDLSLDVEQFTQCLDSGEKNEIIERDFSEARALRVRGTPTIFVNEKPIVGLDSYRELKKMIDEAMPK